MAHKAGRTSFCQLCDYLRECVVKVMLFEKQIVRLSCHVCFLINKIALSLDTQRND